MRQCDCAHVCACAPQAVVCSASGVDIALLPQFCFVLCFVPLPYNLWLLLLLLLLLSCCSHETLEKCHNFFYLFLFPLKGNCYFTEQHFPTQKEKTQNSMQLHNLPLVDVWHTSPWFAVGCVCVLMPAAIHRTRYGVLWKIQQIYWVKFLNYFL